MNKLIESFTSTPPPGVHTLQAAYSSSTPEFVDVPGLYKLFAIRRSLAYELIKAGAIKSVSLRRRGQLRGKRLFFVDSVRQYLLTQMAGGDRDGTAPGIAPKPPNLDSGRAYLAHCAAPATPQPEKGA